MPCVNLEGMSQSIARINLSNFLSWKKFQEAYHELCKISKGKLLHFSPTRKTFRKKSFTEFNNFLFEIFSRFFTLHLKRSLNSLHFTTLNLSQFSWRLFTDFNVRVENLFVAFFDNFSHHKKNSFDLKFIFTLKIILIWERMSAMCLSWMLVNEWKNYFIIA